MSAWLLMEMYMTMFITKFRWVFFLLMGNFLNPAAKWSLPVCHFNVMFSTMNMKPYSGIKPFSLKKSQRIVTCASFTIWQRKAMSMHLVAPCTTVLHVLLFWFLASATGMSESQGETYLMFIHIPDKKHKDVWKYLAKVCDQVWRGIPYSSRAE